MYLGPGFDSRHLHQLFNIMQKLFENFRRYLLTEEAKGLDDIGMTLGKTSNIDMFESKLKYNKPWI